MWFQACQWRLACVSFAVVWVTSAQAAQYPITGNARFQIAAGIPLTPFLPVDRFPIPIGSSEPPEGKIYAQPGALITQASTGSDPRTITIPRAVFKHPGTPPGVLPLYGANNNLWQIRTAINVTLPITPLRPGDQFLNVLQKSGRTGPPTVSWCPGLPLSSYSCSAAGAGPITAVPGILRYRKTSNQFGGPLSVRFGGVADIALRVGGAPPPCSFVTTTCWAFFAIGSPLPTGVIGGPFGRWTKTTGPPPSPGHFNIVALKGGTITYITPTGLGAGIPNPVSSWGGPWTTGQVQVTVITSKPFPGTSMFTRTGSDMRVSGVGTISLIAGSVSNRGTIGPTANCGWLNITVPEPAAVVSAASAFLLLVACHSLVRRWSR